MLGHMAYNYLKLNEKFIVKGTTRKELNISKMNELEIFENEEFGQVRTLVEDDEIWFVSADVCDALNIKNVSDAVARLEVDEKGIDTIDTLGGKQQMSVVNEYGLYNLVLGSRKKEAKKFK